MERNTPPVRWAATMVVPWLLLGCGVVRAELGSGSESASARGESMSNPAKPSSAGPQQVPTPREQRASPTADSGRRETALLAGGCFWGVEELLRELPGVISTEVGYTGGVTADPRYEDVHAGFTGHAEAVEIVFDPARVSYEELLLFFFKLHDPTTLNRQGNDVGTSYRSAIFYTSEEQRQTARAVKERIERSGAWKRPIVTEITRASKFYSAEDYHQDYLQKHPGGYTCHFVRELTF